MWKQEIANQYSCRFWLERNLAAHHHLAHIRSGVKRSLGKRIDFFAVKFPGRGSVAEHDDRRSSTHGSQHQ